jgi:dUTP pyrophosphatase
MAEEIRIRIQRLPGNEDIPLPRYMTDRSSGMDIHAAVGEETIIPQGGIKAVPTGIAVSIPEGYEAQIRPRSGLAVNSGITLINAPGTVDADYRGEIRILLINLGREPYAVRRGDRIAQMVIQPVCRVEWNEVESLDPTQRGGGGFGHTG